MLIILTGKTAAGKDTIKSAILKKYPSLKKIITNTSRAKRAGDVDGVDYRFLSREEFEQKIDSGEFAEYVEYGGNLYGTLKKDLEQAVTYDTLWKIDPSRAGEAKEFIHRVFPPNFASELSKRLLVIYINTPDEVILKRLRNRGLSETEIQKRMDDDQKIWQKFKDSYGNVVENTPGKLETTVAKITQIIESRKTSPVTHARYGLG